MADTLKSLFARARVWLPRFWEDMLDRRQDLAAKDDEKPSELTVAGVAGLLVGAATQVGALTDWADKLFLDFGEAWAPASKILSQIIAIWIAIYVISKTKTVSSDSASETRYVATGAERLGAKILLVFVIVFSLPDTLYREVIKEVTAPLVMHVASVCKGSLTPVIGFELHLRDRAGHELLSDTTVRTDDGGVVNVDRPKRFPLPYIFVVRKVDGPEKEYVAFYQDVKREEEGLQVQFECKGDKQ